MAVALIAVACGGGGGGDSFSAPLSAGVADALGRAPDGVINAASASSVEVEVELPEDTLEGDEVRVELSDGTSVASITVPALVGGGTMTVGPIDASGLEDGPIDIVVTLVRDEEELSSSFADALVMDTTPPLAATSVVIAAGAGNPENVVSAQNVAETVATVTFDGAADVLDLATILVTDGASTVQSLSENVFAGGSLAFQPMALSELLDGELMLTVRVQDAAENTADLTIALVKDTVLPGVVAAHVTNAGPGIDAVNLSTQDRVRVEVQMDDTVSEGDMVAVTLADGLGTEASSQELEAPLDGGLLVFEGIDVTSLIDGDLVLSVNVSDSALNANVQIGTVASKDATISSPVTLAFRGGHSANQSVVAGSLITAAFIEAHWEKGGANETVIFSLRLTGQPTTAFGPFPLTAPTGKELFGPFDLSALQDGRYRVSCQIQDDAGNERLVDAKDVMIDREAHPGHSAASILAGVANAASVINASSENAVAVRATTLPYTGPNVTAVAILTDGVTTVRSSGAQAPKLGGVVDFAPMDASALAQGLIKLHVEYVDGTGNLNLYDGTGAERDSLLVMPTAAHVAAGADNAMDFVNAASATTAAIQVGLSAPAVAGDVYTLQVSAGGASLDGPSMVMTGGETSISFSGLDLSSLPDGQVAIAILVSDAAQNGATFAGTMALKDVEIPSTTLHAYVAAGADNGINEINATNVDDARVFVGFEAASEIGDLFTVTLSDGSVSVQSPTYPIPASRLGIFRIGQSVAAFADGPVTLTVSLMDAAGNAASTAGSPAVKTTAGIVPVSASVVPTMGLNPADYVNAASETSVTVEVTMPNQSTTADEVRVRMVGSGAVSAAPQQATDGGGTMTFTLDASTLGDGPVALNVEVVNPQRDTTQFTGTPATKDTVAPATAVLYSLVQSFGAQGFVTAATSDSTTVDVSYQSATTGGETMELTITDGNLEVVAGSQALAAAAVPPTLTYAGIDVSSLQDGPLGAFVTVTDAAGNEATSSTTTFATKDVSPPSHISDLHVTLLDGSFDDRVNVANVNGVIVTFAALDGMVDDVVAVRMVDAMGVEHHYPPVVLTGPSARVLAGSGDLGSLADGNMRLFADVTDKAGNTYRTPYVIVLKDTVMPAVATAAAVVAGSNPADVINIGSESAVAVDVTFAATSVATDMFEVVLSDGVNEVRSAATPAASGAGTVSVGGVDCSSLTDGAITMSIEIEDAGGNAVQSAGTPALKDTVITTVTAASIPAGADWAAEVVNDANVGAVQVEASIGVSADGTETVIAAIGDGIGSVETSAQMVAPGGGTMTFPTLDVSALVDGAIVVTVTITDDHGNTATTTTMASKDAMVPAQPLAAFVPVDGTHGANQVNAASVGAVDVSVQLDASSSASDTVMVTLSDGLVTASGSAAASAGAGTITVSGIDASALADGAISISVEVTDAADNASGAFAGTPASKDVAIPTLTAVTVTAGAGWAADVVNATNVGTVVVDATIGATADGDETIIAALGDGVASVDSGSQAVVAGGGAFGFAALDASSLADGAISVNVTLTDDHGNSVMSSVPALKDVVAPAAPLAAAVPASLVNAADWISIATESSVSVTVQLDASSEATDVVTVVLDDGVTTVSGTTSGSAGAGSVTVSGIDASSLGEGAVAIVVDVVDAAGNETLGFGGTMATKDVTAPTDPIVDPVTTPWASINQMVTGAADAGIAVQIDGGDVQATGTADGDGYYELSVTLTAAMSNVLVVRTIDVAGNPSNDVSVDFNGGALTVLHDAAAPPAPFTDATLAAGLGDLGAVDGGGFADIDGDGDLDLFVGSNGNGLLYENVGGGVFSDISVAAGGPFIGSASAVWGDFDNDGDPDLLTVSGGNLFLYANQFVELGTKTFLDVSVATMVTVPAVIEFTQAFWMDWNADGHLDVLALDAAASSNLLLEGNGATFAQNFTSGVDANVSSSRLGAVGDYDIDGDMDVLFGDTVPSVFYRNDGIAFTDVGVASGVSFDHGLGDAPIAFVDYDGDGDLDVWVAHDGGLGDNRLFRNDGLGTFTDVAASANLGLALSIDDVSWGDFDNDGDMDLYAGSNGANQLWTNVGDVDVDGVQEFVDLASASGVGVADLGDAEMVQMADVDGDGDLDLFVGNEAGTNVLYRNGLVGARHLTVRLVGNGVNTPVDAIGAVVVLKDKSGAVVGVREVNGGRGNGSQDPALLHFGGIAPSHDYTVEVTWPGGSFSSTVVTPRLLVGQSTIINQ